MQWSLTHCGDCGFEHTNPPPSITIVMMVQNRAWHVTINPLIKYRGINEVLYKCYNSRYGTVAQLLAHGKIKHHTGTINILKYLLCRVWWHFFDANDYYLDLNSWSALAVEGKMTQQLEYKQYKSFERCSNPFQNRAISHLITYVVGQSC